MIGPDISLSWFNIVQHVLTAVVEYTFGTVGATIIERFLEAVSSKIILDLLGLILLVVFPQAGPWLLRNLFWLIGGLLTVISVDGIGK